nr:MAG TPA: hypothetical protein [Caudoviricetes sp.]
MRHLPKLQKTSTNSTTYQNAYYPEEPFASKYSTLPLCFSNSCL